MSLPTLGRSLGVCRPSMSLAWVLTGEVVGSRNDANAFDSLLGFIGLMRFLLGKSLRNWKRGELVRLPEVMGVFRVTKYLVLSSASVNLKTEMFHLRIDLASKFPGSTAYLMQVLTRYSMLIWSLRFNVYFTN